MTAIEHNARLRKSADIDRVFKAKQSIGTKFFVLYFIDNQQQSYRLAMIVSKRVSKRAVVRNRIRRQIREYARLHPDAMGNRDVVIIARAGGASLENAACRAELDRLFQRWYKRLAERSSH